MKLTTWIALLFLLVSCMVHFQQAAFAEEESTTAVEQIININTADAKTLSTLPGVGIKKAEAIVDFRERNGDFKSVEELVNVKGIGKKMMEKIAAKISV